MPSLNDLNDTLHGPSQREVMVRLNGMENTLTAKFDGLREVIDERDQKYTERDQANKDAVRAALAGVEKLGELTSSALKEYKQGANEWRTTVQDLIAGLREARSEHSGQSGGIHIMWGYVVGAIGIIAFLYSVFEQGRRVVVP